MYKRQVKKGITAGTVGAATLEDLDNVYSAQAEGWWYPAYDFVNQKFDFTNMWVPAMNRLAEMCIRDRQTAGP